jgi:fluoride exporter
MHAFLLIGAGGAIGANLRYLVSTWAAARFGTGFPYGTLIANLAGSFAIGLFYGVVTARFHDNVDARLLVATGFLGAETTFSTLSYESVALLRQADLAGALRNLLGSTLLGLACTGAGLVLADLLVGGGR